MIKEVTGQSLPIRRFMEAVQMWVDAVDRGDMTSARVQADQFRAVGRMLAVDPPFRAVYFDNNQVCQEESVEHAVDCMHAFMTAIADAALGGHYRPEGSENQTREPAESIKPFPPAPSEHRE